MRFHIVPSTEIVVKQLTVDGKVEVLAEPCKCADRIPGLDSEFCRECRIWWRDKAMEEMIRRRRSSGSAHDTAKTEGKKAGKKTGAKPEREPVPPGLELGFYHLD